MNNIKSKNGNKGNNSSPYLEVKNANTSQDKFDGTLREPVYCSLKEYYYMTQPQLCSSLYEENDSTVNNEQQTETLNLNNNYSNSPRGEKADSTVRSNGNSVEGGYVNDPIDDGGSTNWGISEEVWKKSANKVLGVEPTLENQKALSKGDAKRIYIQEYWNKAQIDEIDDLDIKYALFDFYVNAPVASIKVIQRILNDTFGMNLMVDGAIGPNTIDAINSVDADKLYDKYIEGRAEFYYERVRQEPANAKYINGWQNRVNLLRKDRSLKRNGNK